MLEKLIAKKELKKMFLKLGIILCIIGVIAAIILAVVSKNINKGFLKYDYNLISQKGKQLKGTIKNINVVNNISYNGINPRIITYSYLDEGQVNEENFQTIEKSKVDVFKLNDTIDIVVYNKQSVISNLTPYKISLKLFWILPIIFVIIGCILVFISKVFISDNNVRVN